MGASDGSHSMIDPSGMAVRCKVKVGLNLYKIPQQEEQYLLDIRKVDGEVLPFMDPPPRGVLRRRRTMRLGPRAVCPTYTRDPPAFASRVQNPNTEPSRPSRPPGRRLRLRGAMAHADTVAPPRCATASRRDPHHACGANTAGATGAHR
eukprot:5077765-Prymnesium_polylepis.1